MRVKIDCGDKVIYPGHGVALVDDSIEKLVAGNKIKFFKLVFLFKDMTILVPTYNIDSVGIRLPSSDQATKEALDELAKKPHRQLESIDFTPSGWNRRHKDYQLKIQSGQLKELVKIYRDLMYISQQKELSFGERSLLQTTEELIGQELQVVKNETREQALHEIRSPFKQFMYFGEKSFAHESISALPH